MPKGHKSDGYHESGSSGHRNDVPRQSPRIMADETYKTANYGGEPGYIAGSERGFLQRPSEPAYQQQTEQRYEQTEQRYEQTEQRAEGSSAKQSYGSRAMNLFENYAILSLENSIVKRTPEYSHLHRSEVEKNKDKRDLVGGGFMLAGEYAVDKVKKSYRKSRRDE